MKKGETIMDAVARVTGVRTDYLGWQLEQLPAEERREALQGIIAITNAFDAGEPMDGAEALSFILKQVQVRARTEYRKRSNRKTDTKRRTTIGCKGSYRMKEKCYIAAAREGLSLNAWVHKVLSERINGCYFQYLDDIEEDDTYIRYGGC